MMVFLLAAWLGCLFVIWALLYSGSERKRVSTEATPRHQQFETDAPTSRSD
ncbi:hypothetical protein [Halorussus halophilus]|uniref:hypothetical protein n=1 Tax=Halorussus halophilus TaxID=2650975 RepID=UPI0017883B6D|nr:hypothetical protein [Halorussus halophilus]